MKSAVLYGKGQLSKLSVTTGTANDNLLLWSSHLSVTTSNLYSFGFQVLWHRVFAPSQGDYFTAYRSLGQEVSFSKFSATVLS